VLPRSKPLGRHFFRGTSCAQQLLAAFLGVVSVIALAVLGLLSGIHHSIVCVVGERCVFLGWTRLRWQPCYIELLPQWLLPCLAAIAVVGVFRLLGRPAVRQVLLISSPALGAAALALFLLLSSFSRQSWSEVASLHSARWNPSPNLVSWPSDRPNEICRGWAGNLGQQDPR
jgi:hypothetical protein